MGRSSECLREKSRQKSTRKQSPKPTMPSDNLSQAWLLAVCSWQRALGGLTDQAERRRREWQTENNALGKRKPLPSVRSSAWLGRADVKCVIIVCRSSPKSEAAPPNTDR